MEKVEVTLPGGMAVAGRWHRTACLRAVRGEDERFLAEEGHGLLPAARATALLARCLAALGPLAPVPPDSVRALTAGDREALLLHLRKLTLGERLACVLTCPACGEKMDLDLRVPDLLLPPYADPRASYQTVVDAADGPWRVEFRLPTGGDQEAAAPLARTDLAAAANQVLRRCVQQVTPPGGDALPADALPAAVAARISERMAELDPQAQLVLSLTCPECDAAFDVLLDAADYLFQELEGQSGALYREVHWLALHYHWSEADILALTTRKRRLFLGLLAEEVGGERSR